jgi:phage replication O-like protein O
MLFLFMKLTVEKPNYTQVPNVILDNMAEFTHVEFKVVMLICRYTFGFHREKHRLSYSFIERACGLHCNSVNNALHSLFAKGVVSRFELGDTFEYTINTNDVATLQDSPHYQIVQATLPDSPKKERDKETNKESTSKIPDNLNAPKFVQHWEMWKQHRKEKKKPMTELSAKIQLEKLSKIGVERSIAAITHSIACGYQGIFESPQQSASSFYQKQAGGNF